MRPKEPLSEGEKSFVIYRINCNNCPCNYVGETTKHLQTRVHEHELAAKEQRSQVWTHMSEHGHTFNFAGAEVIAQDPTKGRHLLKKAWLSSTLSTGMSSYYRHTKC